MEKEILRLRKSRLRYRISLSACVFLLVLSSIVILLNWDYISYKYFISNYYIHTDALSEVYKDSIGMDVNHKYYRYFDNLAISLLARELREKAEDPYTFQYNPNQYKNYQVWREEKAKFSYVEELSPDTVYMLITNFTSDSYNFFKKNIETISKYENFVLDLRDNGGGDLDVMVKISDAFLDKNQIVSIEKSRSREKELTSKREKTLSFKNIVIIQNGHSASASELLIMALSENLDNVITVGSNTYGKSVGQTVLNLMRGFHTRATTLMFLSPQSRMNINNIGIKPDIIYEEEDVLDYIISDILMINAG